LLEDISLEMHSSEEDSSEAYSPEEDSLEMHSSEEDSSEAYSPEKDSPEEQDGFEEQSIPGLSSLYFPKKGTDSRAPDIANILKKMGKLTPEQHEKLHQDPHKLSKTGSDSETMLLKTGLINEDDILEARAKQHGMELRHISPETVDRDAFKKLEIDFIRNNGIVPIAIEEDTLVVAISDPANVFAIDEVKRQTEMELDVVVCSTEEIEAVCAALKESEQPDYCVDELISDMTDVEIVAEPDEVSEDLEKMAGQSPVIKFVNYLISNAIHEGASDIHIEPKTKFTKARYRIDGVLFETMQAPLKMHPAVVSRIKIMSNLDISERRLPQDGKISVIVGGRGVDLRISTLPTSHGEKVVIRVLDSKSILRGLDQLGMEPEVTEALRRQVGMPHGILLVTGPTGSGKSTTLYSAIGHMDGEKLNISTVEDPVEYELGFCNQVHVNEKIGLSFASALRSLLRQDPDIIMIGEIRDNETARIAVQAALTGHLVLSTLHTNDAASSVTRLVNIGIDAYLIAASLNAVLAQRLVRRICSKCKEIYQIPAPLKTHIEKAGGDPDNLYHGVGCDSCRGSGYSGRAGIYELLIIDEQFKTMINTDTSVNSMRSAFYKTGQPTLFDDGIKKVLQGLTTVEEVLRVTEIAEAEAET
jgi:type IV pilus assembly protein PilB